MVEGTIFEKLGNLKQKRKKIICLVMDEKNE